MLTPYKYDSKHYVHSDGRVLRTGKNAPVFDTRTLKFENYLAADAPPPPPVVNWYKSVTDWLMLANDTLGDCTIASKFHDVQVAAVNTVGLGADATAFTDADAIKYYSLWDGYVPGDPNTDQGGVILNVLKQWQKQRLNGHRLFAFTSLNPQNAEHVKKAIELFGVVDHGLELPISAQSQVGGLWDVVGDPENDPDSQPGSWGGHDVSAAAYDVTTGEIVVITWGALQRMTWKFWNTYVDEAYALIMGMTLANNPTGFTGFNLAQLEQDLAVVTG
jgi:hypothetical protein